MKKILAILSTIAVFAPAVALAAYNDVTLTAGTVVINANSIPVNVTGSDATIESIAVDGTTITVSVQPNSTMSVVAPNRNLLVYSSPTAIPKTSVCDSSNSSLTFSGGASGVSVTISPSSDLCADAASSGGGSGGGNGAPVGGGGGGGGGGVYSVPVAAPAAPTPPDQAATIASLIAQLKSLVATLKALGGTVSPQLEATLAAFGGGASAATGGSLTSDLQVGSTGDQVKWLQAYLNAHGYTIASSGPGSPGNETTKFGSATKAALIKLQKAAGLSPASGFCGPKTRAYIAANP